MQNTNELRGRLGAKQISVTKFAELMGMSRPTARRKIDGKVDFTISEMFRACEILDIAPDDAARFFLPAGSQNGY